MSVADLARSAPAQRPPGRLDRAWPGIALTASQLAIMAANLLLSLLLAHTGGVAAVGAIAPGVLLFQFGTGLLQQVLAEASLLAEAGATRRVAADVGRWAVAVAMLGGVGIAVLAVLFTLTVPDGNPLLGLVYAAGLPAAHALDIGRAAAVARHHAKSAAIEAAAWGLTLAVAAGAAAMAGSPLGICLAWTVTSWAYALGTAAFGAVRRPRFTGAVAWLRSQRRFAGAASVDALLTGIAPLLAIQVTALITTAAVVGSIRIVQQLFAPLAFISITTRKLLIFRRSPDQPATRSMAIRDGLVAVALTAVGAAVLGGLLLGVRGLVPSLAFLPGGLVVLLAGVEKAGQGLTFGATLGKFLERDFATLLRARYAFVALNLGALPVLAYFYGAPGFLAASAATCVLYVLILLVLPRWRAR